MTALGHPNDGLVPALSAQLDGATNIELSPTADHAAPAMIVTPFKNFWTDDHRNEVTMDFVQDGIDAAAP